MASWSEKRKFVYGGTLSAVIIIIIGLWAFTTFYKPPTCFDGIQNGGEGGVDCGGICVKLCASSFLPPQVRWTSFKQVAPGLYNTAAYIVNPNTEGIAINAPYHIVLYDNKGVVITDVSGTVSLPPHRNTLAFLPSVDVGKRVPYRAFFEFVSPGPDWKKAPDTLGALQVGDKKYTEDVSGSSLIVTLANSSVYPIGRISVYAILSDAESNVVDFSKTIIDGIDPQSSVSAPFTWPSDHKGSVISIEVLPVAE